MSSRLVLLVLVVLLVPGHASSPAPVADTDAMPVATGHGSWHTARHVDPAAGQLYVAQSLTSMRWDVGLTQEHWWGRPLWVEPVTGRGVRVAVVDTGIDPTHPDLVGSVAAWADLVHGRLTPYDDDTHGTHVAGIIAAHGHVQWRPDQHYFPFGAKGVAPDARLLVAKAMDREGDGDAGSVARAILWALDPNGDGDRSDGAHIINLSIGLETPPEGDRDGLLPGPITLPTTPRDAAEERRVREAIDTAVRAGAVVVVAAGNHEAGAQHNTVSFPGNLPNVITVGAVDPDGRAAMFSNEGAPGSTKPDLVAPGILLSTFPRARDAEDAVTDGYVALGGTSMAAPVVAGTIALMMEADPTLGGLTNDGDRSANTERVRRVLTETADPIGAGHNNLYGHGRLRASAAVDAVDTGQGPTNWDALLVVALAVAAVVGVTLMRRRKRDLDLQATMLARDRRLERQADAGGDGAPGAHPAPGAGTGAGAPWWHGEAAPSASVGTGSGGPPRSAPARDDDGGDRDGDATGVPDDQRPPWAR